MVFVIAPLARWGRLFAFFLGILAVCLYCEVIGRVWCLWLAAEGSAKRVRRANRVTRHWHVALTELTFRLLGCRLDVRGTIPPLRYVVVSNHQSIADIALLPWALRRLNVKFVAKKELARGIPTVSMALRHWGSALISREGTRDDIARMKSMARSLAHWEGSVVVFPEGTRSRDGSLLPYKSGAVRIIANEARLPLLPVAIDGTHLVSELAQFARLTPGAHGTVTIGTPIPPEIWEGRLDDVVEEIRMWAFDTIQRGRCDRSEPPP
jgi:1-acyl-sn-glycerol-3-phosphate acyltransferase